MAGLAQFFPDAVSLRVPVEVRMVDATTEISEKTVIEFGTANDVLFCSRMPLEFGTVVALKAANGVLEIEASVIAMQYREGAETAVAAKFTSHPANWIVKTDSGKGL